MSRLRVALLSLPLLVSSTAAAQAAPAATASTAEPVAAQAPAATTAPAPAGVPAAGASSKAAPPTGRYGLGVSFGGRGSDPTLYVPIDSGRVRVEFEAAFATGSAGDAHASSSHLGLGAFGLIPAAAGTQVYVGGRVQYVHLGATGASSDGGRVAFALGGEWSPAPVIALGVEWQLGYTAASGSTKGGDATALAFLRIFPGSFERSDAASPAAAKPKPARVVRCEKTSDCGGVGICLDGVCRR